MNNFDVCPVSGETPHEERVNHLTHLFGLGLSVIGWVFLIVHASLSMNVWNIVSCLIYGASLVFMYAASTFYHGCKRVEVKARRRVIDHIAIYLLIAGSYTPFTLGPLRAFNGWSLLSIVWVVAILGTVMKLVAIHRFKTLSLLSYLGLGWLVIFSMPTLSNEISFMALFWIVVGGLSYTVGTLFYIWESLPYNHALWHLFVMGGSASHYCSIFCLVTS